MSLKTRLQKNRQNKSFSSSFQISGCDLISFFNQHQDFDTITFFSHDKIFGEKNGFASPLPSPFSSPQIFLQDVYKIIDLFNTSPVNNYLSIPLNDDSSINIYLPPLSVQPLIIFSKQKNYKLNSCFNNKLLSSEIISFLNECTNNRANIFIVGNASVDKLSVLNCLLLLQNQNKKIILCQQDNKLDSSLNCAFRFSKNILKSNFNLPYDNIFCSDISDSELINIFKLIISGYRGFVVSSSLNNNVDFLSALRNIILLSNINLFEENADFMISSAVDFVVFVENTQNHLPRIIKVSELSKNNHNVLNDIFLWNENFSMHSSTGHIPKFLYNYNKPDFNIQQFQQFYQHHYSFDSLNCSFDIISKKLNNSLSDNSSNLNLNCSQNPYYNFNQNDFNSKNKIQKLKEKIKQFKAEKILLQKNKTNSDNFQMQNLNDQNLCEKSSKMVNYNDFQQNKVQNICNEPLINNNFTDNQNPPLNDVPKSDASNIINQQYFDNSQNDNIYLSNQLSPQNDIPVANSVINENLILSSPDSTKNNSDNNSPLSHNSQPNDNSQINIDTIYENIDIDENYSGRINVEQIDLVDSDNDSPQNNSYTDSNDGLLASENDGFSDEYTIPQKKIKNILDESNYDEFSHNNQIVQPNPDSDNSINQKNFNNNNIDIFTEKYQKDLNKEQQYEEPELFDEIKDIDIDNYDIPDIPNEDV